MRVMLDTNVLISALLFPTESMNKVVCKATNRKVKRVGTIHESEFSKKMQENLTMESEAIQGKLFAFLACS